MAKSSKAKREKRKKIQYGSAKKRAENHDSGFSSKALKRPDGFSWFRLGKAGIYNVDIIPFIVGEGNPCADSGTVYYERTYYVHKNVGPNNDTVCCSAKTFNKRCYICEVQAKMRRDPKAKKEQIKPLNWSERQLFLIKEHVKPGEEDKGVQIFDQSHFLFGKLLDSRVKGSDEDDNYENFFHLQGGQKLKLTVEEESFEGRPYFKVAAIDFKPRKDGADYEESILDEVPCLDDIPIEMPYDKMKKLFLAEDVDGDEDEDDEDDEKPKKKKKGKVRDDDDDDDDEGSEDDDGDDEEEDDEDESEGEEDDEEEGEESDDDEEEDEDDDGKDDYEVGDKVKFRNKKKKVKKGTIKKINSKTKMVLIEDEDEDAPIAVPLKNILSEIEEEDDEEEEEEPKPKKKGKKVVDEDEDDDIPFDDEDEDDEEDEPRRKGKIKKKVRR